MPLITETEARKDALLPVGTLPEDEEEQDPGFGELFAPALRLQNTLISGGRALGTALEREQARARNKELGQEPTRYNPFQDIQGYEPWSASFRDSESPEDTAIVKRKIDRENEDKNILYAGGLEGFAAQLAAGAIDPINLVPIGGTLLRGKGILRSAGETAGVGAAVSTAAELALQGSQETRTLEESVTSIGAATLLSGILGAAVPLVRNVWNDLGARTTKDLEIPPLDRPDPLAPGGVALNRGDLASMGAAAVDRGEAKLKSALGVDKIASPMSPLLRSALSPSIATRRATQELVETPFFYTDNALGVATPVAVETRVKMWQSPLAESMEEMDRLYSQYRTGGGELKSKAFREEIGRAMRRNDEHDIPEIAQAARAFRQKLFDPTKAQAIAVKLLPEDVKVETAESYLSRVYNVEKITARRDEFVERITKWLVLEHHDIDALELREIAQEVTDHILGVSDGRIPYEAVQLKRGPLKERVLNIPDAMIEDFLESDIETISRFYTRTIVPDIELARTFGDPTMRDAITKVTDNYKDLIAAAQTEAARKTLGNRRDADVRDLAAMRDRLRGTYAAPADPDGYFVRGARFVRNWNYLSLLGSMTVSAIPDLARTVTVHGLMRTLKDGVIPLVTNFRAFKISAQEAKRAGTALDMVLDSRAMELGDIGDVYGRHSKFERGTQYLTERFSKVTLMAPWNAALKQFASVVTQDRILTAAVKGGDVEHLAATGIDADIAGRIAEQFRKFGSEDGGVKLANTQAWTDRVAIKAFRAAIVREADRIIVTPGIGDRPLWMSNELGKVIGQFRSFAFASTQKVLISGLQQRDMAVLNGTLLSVALGMGVYGMHAKGLGKETSDNPVDWIREGFDRSGVLGWLYEANNVAEKATAGRVGLNRLIGGGPSLRFSQRGAFGAIAGPTVGRVEDAIEVAASSAAGDLTEADVRSMRRLLPYQNVFYLRFLFNQLEDGAQQAFGGS